MTLPQILENLVGTIERAEVLDRPGELVVGLVQKVVRPGPVEDTLGGTPFGHPLHPVLVAVPIGAWVSAGVLDALGERSAARKLVALGCVVAVPTAATGASDLASTSGPERRVGLVHAALTDAAVASYVLSWRRRRHGNQKSGVAWSLAGVGLLTAAGWLGGHLAYARGVGVDTTAFQHLPTEWTEVMAIDEVPSAGTAHRVDLDGTPLLVARHQGEVVVMADRCTHRGAPLHEGPVADGCVTCPWHGSEFSLVDGTVVSGPATRPQPVFETRVVDGRLQVRRPEASDLQTNPV